MPPPTPLQTPHSTAPPTSNAPPSAAAPAPTPAAPPRRQPKDKDAPPAGRDKAGRAAARIEKYFVHNTGHPANARISGCPAVAGAAPPIPPPRPPPSR